jgi:hypothetical protein
MNSNHERCVMRKMYVIVGAIFLIHTLVPFAFAWSIRPEATELNQMIRDFNSIHSWRFWGYEASDYLIETYTVPVHEVITNCIYGCRYIWTEHNFDDCSPSKQQKYKYAPNAVLAGVRWNDNPPFQLTGTNVSAQRNCVGSTIQLPANNAKCWTILFYDAQRGAVKRNLTYDGESGHALLYRVHFGDMQFLHSMATRDGETAGETKDKIMVWAEFVYKVSLGEIKYNAFLYQCGIPGVEALFKKKRGWTVQMLFTWDDPTYKPYKDKSGLHDKEFREFAFGTLLHMVQDSFSKSHVRRNPGGGYSCEHLPDYSHPGKIESFHSFRLQKYRSHSAQDTAAAFMENVSRNEKLKSDVIDVGVVLRDYYESNKSWEDLKEYLHCVYDLEDASAVAGPGDEFM